MFQLRNKFKALVTVKKTWPMHDEKNKEKDKKKQIGNDKLITVWSMRVQFWDWENFDLGPIVH